MDTPDFPTLLSSITRCNAVYEPDDATARAAFAALGCTVLDRYSDADAQAVAIITPAGRQELVIAGTRASEGSLLERLCDVNEDVLELFTPLYLGGGAAVATGGHHRAAEIWRWAAPLFSQDRPVDVTGHSLGGVATHAMLAVMPPSWIGDLIAWEPPKAANARYWQQFGGALARCLTVVHGRDWWAAYPWISTGLEHLTHPPGPMLWLHDGAWEWVTRDSWPGGLITHMGDHDTTAVMAAVQGLV